MDLMALVPNELPWNMESKKTSRVVHNCRVPIVGDEIDGLVKGTRVIDKMRRWIIRKAVLSRNHPIARTFIKSSAAVNYEISRHIRSYPYMIYPFSKMRSFWESFMIIFIIIALIIVPVALAFDFERPQNWFYVILFINVVFLLDIVMTFFTGHYDDRTRMIILDRKIVAGKYLKDFFVLDLLSSIPVEVFHLIISGRMNANWYYSILNLTKIFRLRTIICYSRRLRHLYRISFRNYKIFEISLIIFLSLHWAACLELYIALVGREIDWKNADRRSWITSELMKSKDTKFKIYLACANRATTSLVSSSHFFDVKTPEDILLNLLLTVVGRVGFIYIIAQFLQLMMTFYSTSKKNMKLLNQLHEYMRYKELPYAIQRRLLDYFDYCNKKRFDRDKYIVSNVSPCLRDELLLHNYSRLVNNVEFFQYMPRTVIVQVVGLLRREVYLPNDTIVKTGTIGDALFFVASGTVAIYTNAGKEVCHLEDGSHFGDVSLVMENDQRSATIVAVEICEIWILKRPDFLRCLAPYPNLLNHLQKIAIERLEKNLLTDSIRYHDSPTMKTPIIKDVTKNKNKENS